METFTCRSCMKRTATISLFTKDNDTDYSLKIKKVINSITIEENDSLPQHICTSCNAELSIAYEFVNRYELSDRTLRLDFDTEQSLCGSPQDMEQLEMMYDDIKPEALIPRSNDIGCDIDFLFEDCGTNKGLQLSDYNTNEIEMPSADFVLEDVQKPLIEETKRPKTMYVNPTNFTEILFEHEETTLNSKQSKSRKLDKIQCSVCGVVRKCQSALNIHMRTHTGEKPFRCANCDSEYSIKGSLKRHIETHHLTRERKFTCETCGCSFFRKNDIMIHNRRHTGERPHKCSVCDKSFLQNGALVRHTRTHTGDKPYSCSVCQKAFSDKSLLVKHGLVHSDVRNFICQICNKGLKSNYSLKMHMRIHVNDKRNICIDCGMAFASKGNLKTHIKRVHSMKCGYCKICSKIFSNIEEHMRIHTGEKPYPCSMCPKALTTKRSLANHILYKHETPHKYKCSVEDCGLTFPTEAMMGYHMLKCHIHETPYVCKLCSKGVYRACDLSRHVTICHTEPNTKDQNETKSKPAHLKWKLR